MAPNTKQIFLARVSDILKINANPASVRLEQSNRQLDGTCANPQWLG
jgi:hypothetical protein